MRICMTPIASVLAAALLASGARAGETDNTTPRASVSLARHYTTNALDSPLAIEDWYTVLRGTIESTVKHEIGTTRVAAELQSRRYDTLDIENDIALGVGADTTVVVSEKLELRGTLSFNLAEEGDELLLGDTFIGIRTRKTVLSAGLQAGMRLAENTTLVLEGSASHETPQLTRFEEGLLLPTQLDPIKDRLRAGAKLTQSRGSFSYGAYGTAGLMRSDPIGFLSELRVLDYAMGLHGSVAFDNGASIAASAGLHGLRLLDADYSELRPAYEAAAVMPLPANFSLRGMLKASYDPKTNDDPVATWVRRIEAEAGYQPTAIMRLAGGVFMETRDNIGLESRETARGLFAEATWQTSPRTTLSLRMDATRKIIEELSLERRAVDVHMAMNVKL